MLDISYTILRDERDEHKLYVPDSSIQRMEGPIVCMTAPNGMGKSTMLNLISYAFYGDRIDEQAHRISPSLHSKIKELGERKDQELEFTISLTSPDGKVQLVSQKENNSNDLIVREIVDGKSRVLPFNTFRDKYFLIYDIPENPIEKLKDISKEVLSKQKEYKRRLSDFRTYLTGLQTEISNARDEEKIQRLRSELAEKKGACEESEEKYLESQQKQIVVNQYYLIREYGYCREKLEELDEKYSQIKVGGLKNTVKKRKFTVQTAVIRNKISNSIYQIQDNFATIKKTLISFDRTSLKKLEKDLKAIQSIDSSQVIDDCEFDSQYIEDLLVELETIISDATDSDELQNAVVTDDFYSDIIEILEHYKSRNVSLPGTTATLQELIEMLREESAKNKNNVDLSRSLKNCQDSFPNIRDDIKVIRENLQSLKLAQNSSADEISEIEDTSSQNTNEITQIKKKIESIKNEMQRIESDFEKYSLSSGDYKSKDAREIALSRIMNENKDYKSLFRLDSALLSQKLQDIALEITNNKRILNDKKERYSRTKHDLELAEKAEPHRYQKYKDSIDKIVNLAVKLDGKLKIFNDAIDNIGHGGLLKTEEEKRYNDILSLYLAQRIPDLPYNGKYYATKRIDLHAKEIETTSGKVIKTSDVSTGQGMSMYIRSLLASDEDNNSDRKYIVIFDEAHTMDRKSFYPIKQELLRMVEKNRLMFALFVKPNSDKFEYKNLE